VTEYVRLCNHQCLKVSSAVERLGQQLFPGSKVGPEVELEVT